MTPVKPVAPAVVTSLVAALLLMCASVAAAAEPLPGEDILPENSIVTVMVPDMLAAQAQFGKTRLAEMFAQPLMQEFLQPILLELTKQEGETLAVNPGGFAIRPSLFKGSLAGAFFASPDDPRAAGIVAVFTPQNAEEFLGTLPPALAKNLREGKLAEDIPDTADIGLAWAKDRLIVCAPRERLNTFVGRLVAAPKTSVAKNPAYAKVKERLAGSIMWTYAAPQAIVALATAQMGNGAERASFQAVWGGLGLDKLDSAGVGFGFKNGELVAESFAGLSAPNASIFSLFFPADATPAPADAFRIAAVDAPYVGAGYFDFAGLLPLLKRNVQALDPRAGAMLDNQLQVVGKLFGGDLQKDFLEAIDGHFVVAQTRADTGLPLIFIPGMVYSFGVKNPAKFQECLGNIDALLMGLPAPIQGKLKLKKITHADKPIYYLSGPILPLSPTLCFTDGRLLVGTSLNAMRRTLEQLQKTETILANKEFQQALARATEQPFSADKIPPLFAYGIDQGSGNGAMLLASAYIAAASGLQIANAALPLPAAANAAADIKVNEANACGECRAYAEAQEIYRRTDYNGNGVLEYAQSIKGDNSLFEREAGAGNLALVPKEFADAEGEPDGKSARKGYRFKVLKSFITEGGETKSYIVNGSMTLGYALLAYPLQYGVTGKRVFIINSNGTTFATDWGAQTAEKAKACVAFNPKGWTEVEDRPEQQAAPQRVETTALALARQVDFGLWPDAAFFAKYSKPTAAVVKFDATGILCRTELPPPLPVFPRMGAGPVVMIGVGAVGAGLILPVLARARESARRTSSASNLNQMAKAAFMYADVPANGGIFPVHPAALVPKYIVDPRVFRNPRFPNEDVSYTWVSGVDPNMATAILAFEVPPPNDHSGGRNVVFCTGTVEWRDDESFAKALAETEKAIKAAKREMRLVPISFAEMQEGKNPPAPGAGGKKAVKDQPEF